MKCDNSITNRDTGSLSFIFSYFVIGCLRVKMQSSLFNLFEFLLAINIHFFSKRADKVEMVE